MEKAEENIPALKSESEDDLDDTLEIEELSDPSPELNEKPNLSKELNLEKVNKLRTQFRDKEFLVKGSLNSIQSSSWT